MKIIHFFQILAFCGLLVLPGLSSAQKTIAQSEQMRFSAQIHQDTVALHRLLANDLAYIHSNALVETKSDFIRSVGGGGIRYLAMQKTETGPVRQWGKTATAIGIVDVKGLYQGKEFDMRLRYTSVYRKSKGIWQLSSWQSTRLP